MACAPAFFLKAFLSPDPILFLFRYIHKHSHGRSPLLPALDSITEHHYHIVEEYTAPWLPLGSERLRGPRPGGPSSLFTSSIQSRPRRYPSFVCSKAQELCTQHSKLFQNTSNPASDCRMRLECFQSSLAAQASSFSSTIDRFTTIYDTKPSVVVSEL